MVNIIKDSEIAEAMLHCDKGYITEDKIIAIKDLEACVGKGDTFKYLGIEMIVKAHMIYIESAYIPGIITEYYDVQNGVFREKEFNFDEFSDLVKKIKDQVPEDLPISIMRTSCRTHGCLKSIGIKKVSDILNHSENDLLLINNFGRKSLDEVIRHLQKYEIKWPKQHFK